MVFLFLFVTVSVSQRGISKDFRFGSGIVEQLPVSVASELQIDDRLTNDDKRKLSTYLVAVSVGVR